MGPNVSAEIVSIGTEILLGEITDTNSVHMARTLRDMGINVYYIISVGDNRKRIAETIRTSLSRSDIVITCGGLGPTVDDVTREAVADATDRELVFEQGLLDAIVARFEQYRVQMTDNNKRQAYLPFDAIPLENPVGTAPAYIVETDKKCVISLPGVPREMKYLLKERVTPFLKTKYDIAEQIILARILKTAGIGESSLDTRIGEEILEQTNPTVGLAAHSGQIDIRITAKANTRADAEALIAPIEAEIQARVGDFIFGADKDQLETVFGTLLREHNAKLAISETGINGSIYNRLQQVSEDIIVHHENHAHPETLQHHLNLPDSTPLQELAQQAAQQLLRTSQAQVCIAVVSQPDLQENTDKEAGTVVVVCTADKTRQRVYGFGGKSENVALFVGNWSTAIAWMLAKEVLNG